MNDIYDIDIDDLTIPGNARAVSRNRVEKLKVDIKKNGLKEPLLVTFGYEIKEGVHRFIACKELGMKEVPCRITDNNDGELLGTAEEV